MNGEVTEGIKKENLEKLVNKVLDNFEENEKKINDLNVFPVPDGDTGTNMLLTLKSVKKELSRLNDFSLKNVLEKASFGALMGSRGNSGVILSQILKGFFDEIIKCNRFDLDVIKKALEASRDLAYGSVQDPTEGTMLTAIKDICEFVGNMGGNNGKVKMIDFLDEVISETEKSVERTTFLLPVLKKADVVDAGAQGILDILIGVKKAMNGIGSLDKQLEMNTVEPGKTAALSGNKSNRNNNSRDKKAKEGVSEESEGYVSHDEKENLKNVRLTYEIKYTYCTELMVKGRRINVERLRERIESFGDSAVVVGNENLVKIHVHTNHPHRILGRASREGSLHDIKINNMKDQREELVEGEEPSEGRIDSSRALMAVSSGEGLEKIFKSVGADIVVSGGQSMNPSTYEMVKAISDLDASEIIILPNNKNIILTANQAKKVVRKKDVYVVQTKSIPAGIAAILSYNPDAGIEENMDNMEQSAKKTEDGEVTCAVRDANLMVGEIKKGEYIGLSKGKVRVVSDNVVDATVDLVRDIADSKKEVITFYMGKDAKKEDIDKIKKGIKKHFPKIDMEIHKGGQLLYHYIFSIE
ncbi:MAG: DAK2 domain-containing protein [Actinomycetota bacterium]|nr:DAK2 domain-containing protein [Actinomycetota bacterium]